MVNKKNRCHLRGDGRDIVLKGRRELASRLVRQQRNTELRKMMGMKSLQWEIPGSYLGSKRGHFMSLIIYLV